MFGMIRNLILDFILYFVTAYIKEYPIHVTSAQGIAQNASSKNIIWKTIYNSNYTQIFFFQNYYSEKWLNIR